MSRDSSRRGSAATPSSGADAAAEREDRAVYIISVAAELAGVHPQTLRIYERKGLLRPARTAGNTRRYSDRDIDRLRMIQRLTQEQGLNLAGVKMIVEMEDQIDRMRERMGTLDRELRQARLRMREEIEQLRRESRRGEIVPAASVPRLRIRVSSQPSRRGPIPVGPTDSSTPTTTNDMKG